MASTAYALSRVMVTSVTYPGTANVTLGSAPSAWCLGNNGNSAVIVSFNGSTDNYILRPGATDPLSIAGDFTTLFLRKDVADGVECEVDVMAVKS